MSALLELQDVEARYGPVQALRGISLEVPEGAVVAVLGANGAGKTTTLRAVSGTVKRSGEILLDGKPLRGGPEAAAKAGVAHVPEGRGTFTELSVRREPAPRRLHAARPVGQGRHRSDGDVLPVDQRPRRAARRHALGRRAADARARPGA